MASAAESASRRSRRSSCCGSATRPGRVFAAESAARPGTTPAVLIGKDTRISGYLLEAALEAGLVRRRRRRLSVRTAAHARGRLSDARAAPVGRHRDQRLAQSVRGQRHQVLLRRRHQAARRGRAGDRAGHRRADHLRQVGGARQGVPRSTTRPDATSNSARARFRTSSTSRA